MAREYGSHLRETVTYPCETCGTGAADFLPGKLVTADDGTELERRRCADCNTEIGRPPRIWVSAGNGDGDTYPG
ncbi:hypothetical protein A4R44_01975 [Amycolatopsis sp. M39]|nr:hypothetical protein A4R44_01975 [Amycolatopsis sp. M39]